MQKINLLKNIFSLILYVSIFFSINACSSPKSSTCDSHAYIGQEVYDSQNNDIGSIIQKSSDCNMILIKNSVPATAGPLIGQTFYIVVGNGIGFAVSPTTVLIPNSNNNQLHDGFFFPNPTDNSAINDINPDYLPRVISPYMIPSHLL